ncbi:MAG: hypothetical protein ACXVRJ_09710 [Gaiellaceae bacterium]
MTTAPRRRAALVGGLVVAAIGAAASPGEATTIPGAAPKLHAAMVQQRSALRTLPRTPGSDRGSYSRPLSHVRAAVTDLLAVQSALAAVARGTGEFPHMARIQQLLDTALTASGTASTQLAQAIWYIDHGAPSGTTVAAPARSEVQQALTADAALAKLLG